MLISVLRKYRPLWLILSGLLLGLTLIFPAVGILEWIALVPAFAVMLDMAADREVKYKRLYWHSFLLFEVFYLIVFHWFFYMYPLDFTGMSREASAVVVCVAWLGLSTFQALGAAFILPVAALAIRGKGIAERRFLHVIILSAAWTFFEWFQANSGWMGVPWGRLPLGQAELEIMLQSSSLIGSYFVTFLLLAVNGILAYILLEPSKKLFAGILAGALFVSNLAIGGICLLNYEDEGEPLTVAIIQGNVSSHDPWAQGSLEQAKEVYRKYSLEAADEGAELIIWPETAFPYNIDRYYDLEIYICNLARECDATILASVFTENEERDPKKLYNSMIAVDNHGMINETVYSKRNLVPFGEFVPWRGVIMRLIPPLAELGMLEEDLLIGKESYVFDLDGKLEGVKVGSLICFDSIYEQNSLESVANGAQLLSVSTNDSWFLDSAAAYMHNEQSCLRAIETGRYVVRAANTGVSTIITPTGEVTELLEPLVEGYIMGEVYLSDRTTLYSSIGDVFVYLCTAFVGATLLLRPISYLKYRRKTQI